VDQLIALCSAWRVMPLGSREVIDALVLPAHRGGSAELRAVLSAWPGSWYWADRGQTHLVLLRARGGTRPRWLLHLALFLLTVLFALGAGAALAGVWYPPPVHGFSDVFTGIGAIFRGLWNGEWTLLLEGWTFAAPLLGILLVHELGHYLAARRYSIDSSPPFFLPIPPTLSPLGTLGAFIRLRSPVLDRRQLLDVGAAGPLAGFVVALAVLVWGYLISQPTSAMPAALRDPGSAAIWVAFAGEPIGLGDSLLTLALRHWAFGDAAAVHLSLPAFAGWVGVFITGLNLLPLSQLDGGHVLYGLLGSRQRTAALVTVFGLLALAQLAPTWYVWVAMTFLIGGGGWSHPSVVVPERPVPPSRRWVGLVSILVFALTFVPLPFAV
jgi:hypothetical protein